MTSAAAVVTVTPLTGQYLQTPHRSLPSDAFSRFMAYVDASPASVQTYRRNLMQFFKWLSENGVDAPTREDVLRYRDYLRQTRRPTTVQNYIAVLRIFFDWLEVEGAYPNAAKKVKGAKVSRLHKRDPLDDDQVKALLKSIRRDTVKGARDYAIVSLMVCAGLRTIEVVRAECSDLTKVRGASSMLVQGKGHDGDRVPMRIPAVAEKAIRDYWTMAGIDPTEQSAPMFRSISNQNRGSQLTTKAVSSIVKAALKGAGFDSDRLTAHSLRHTAVTSYLKHNGMNIYKARQFARHTDINTTLIYVHDADAFENDGACVNARTFFDKD